MASQLRSKSIGTPSRPQIWSRFSVISCCLLVRLALAHGLGDGAKNRQNQDRHQARRDWQRVFTHSRDRAESSRQPDRTGRRQPFDFNFGAELSSQRSQDDGKHEQEHHDEHTHQLLTRT